MQAVANVVTIGLLLERQSADILRYGKARSRLENRGDAGLRHGGLVERGKARGHVSMREVLRPGNPAGGPPRRAVQVVCRGLRNRKPGRRYAMPREYVRLRAMRAGGYGGRHVSQPRPDSGSSLLLSGIAAVRVIAGHHWLLSVKRRREGSRLLFADGVRARRHAPGGNPAYFLKLRLKAASDS